MRDDAEVVRHAEEVQHVAELVDRARIGMLTTMTESGKHVRPADGVAGGGVRQ
jgi:general stress protein 26